MSRKNLFVCFAGVALPFVGILFLWVVGKVGASIRSGGVYGSENIDGGAIMMAKVWGSLLLIGFVSCVLLKVVDYLVGFRKRVENEENSDQR